MTRTSSPPLAVVATVCLLGLTSTGCWPGQTSLAGATLTQPATGPIVIAVVADHFTTGEQIDFTVAVNNLFNNSLFVDPDYADHAAEFTIVPIFHGFVAATPSDYGFQVVPNVTNCGITWQANTTALLEDAIVAVDPTLNPTHIVVIGNDTGAFGCATQNWAYVSKGSVWRSILEHELGHLLAGLFDEYASNAHATHSFPGVLECRNCSTNAVTPHWESIAPSTVSFTNDVGCNLYGQGIIRPTSLCRMGDSGPRFCWVCKREMENAFAFFGNPDVANPDLPCGLPDLPNPDLDNPTRAAPKPPKNLRIIGAGLLIQPPAPKVTPPQPPPSAAPQPPLSQAPQQLVRVLVTLNRVSNAASIQRARNATGRYTPAYRRLGQYVYEVSEAGKTIALGVLVGDPFEVRDYRGSGQRHPVQQVPTADVVVVIPGQTTDLLRTPARAVQINFYRLASNVTAPMITPAVLADLKAKKQVESIAAISPDALRSAM